MLMNHLDENSRKEAQIKASIIDVLSATVLIAAGGSIGLLIFYSGLISSFISLFSGDCRFAMVSF